MSDAFAAFAVVVNAEEQHSIWPVGRDVPAGWTETGFTGDKQECLDHIREIWPDITPLSVRRARGERPAS
ncbi:MbtH family protein [Streptomyces sp. NPDC050759]|uniref:MbtH family protein n=1 Tax=Streptomyces sp. NPDC050759 TaxID=3365635 RepID=UPI003797D956